MRTKTPQLAERMLDAAGELFGTQRFHEVRMDDVAGRAGVSKSTLYRYFRDKEEMYLALLERASRQLTIQLRERVESCLSARDRLVGFIDAVIAFFDAQPHLFDLIQRAEVRHEQGSPFPWQMVRAEGIRLVQEVFAAGKRRGEFTIRSPELATLMLLGGMRAVVRFGQQPRPKNLAAKLVDLFLMGADQPRRSLSRLAFATKNGKSAAALRTLNRRASFD